VPLPFTPEWRAARERSRRAASLVAVFRREPDGADAAWLADAAANGDEDHARWELRYARAALGLLVAQRDALDDRTVAELTAAYLAALGQDPHIAVDRRELAERQFGERLLAYREALQARGGTLSPADRIGRCLLAFASDGARTAGSPLAYAIELLQRYADECAEALREAYGLASLPEDVKPSVVRTAD
jgi:TorA maturation chaperone TorD